MAEPANYKSSSSRLPKEPLIVAALIVVASVTLAVGGIVFKTRDSIQRDKVEFLADANQKQVAPLRRVIQLRLEQDKSRLIQFAATRSALGPGRSRVFGDFALVSLLTPGPGGQWGLSWIEKGPLYSQLQGAQVSISADQEITLLKSLPYDRIREGDIHWQRLSDSSGRPIWALAVSVETQSAGSNAVNPSQAALPEGTDYQSVQVGTGGRAVVVGFFGRNPLLSATEDFIGSSSMAFVIDSRGYAATHSNKMMVGSMLKDDPAVKEVFSARASAGTTRSTNPQGNKVFSAFEQVDRANLYVVMSTPETLSTSTGQSFGRTAVTTGILALLVGLFLVFAWGAKLLPKAAAIAGMQSGRNLKSSDDDQISVSNYGKMPFGGDSGRPNAARMGVSNESNAPLELPDSYKKKPVELGIARGGERAVDSQAAIVADRAAFIGRFVQGLERSMKEPLLAAMAHVQLVKVKAGDAPSKETLREIADHVSSVDRDLRRAKEIIDDLGQLSSQSQAPGAEERADLNRLVAYVNDSHQAAFDKDGIVLKPHTATVPLVRGREEPLRKVLNELLKNAQRALKGRSAKQIQLQLEDAGDSVRLTVSDNGIGMDRETKLQAFDPFYHGFEDPEARGLGLATVRSIVQSQGGRIELNSSPGDGTKVIIDWPVLASERENFEKRPIKVEMFEETANSVIGSHASLDFANEGANALGGKVPLSSNQAGGLPPPPRLGLEDDEKDAWSFDGKVELGDAEVIGEPTLLSEPTEVLRRDLHADGKTQNVNIRPVRRG